LVSAHIGHGGDHRREDEDEYRELKENLRRKP